MILILWLSLWYQAKDNPYLNNDLNSVDFKATFVSFVTIFSGLLSFETRSIEIEIIIVFFFNLLFLYFWVKKMLIIKLPLYMNLKYLKCLNPYFQKMLPEFNKIKAEALKVDLLQAMSSSLKKGEMIQSGIIQLQKEHPRKTIFSHFKYALSKLITGDEATAKNSRFLNSSQDFMTKSKRSNHLAPSPSNWSFMNPNPQNLPKPQTFTLHPFLVQDQEIRKSEVFPKIELIKVQAESPLNRPVEEESSFQIFSADRKDNKSENDTDALLRKRKNLSDKLLIDLSEQTSLRKLLVSKIEEIDQLYDEIADLRREIDPRPEGEKPLAGEKHPLAQEEPSGRQAVLDKPSRGSEKQRLLPGGQSWDPGLRSPRAAISESSRTS